MNDRHERGLLSEIGTLATWAAVICLVASFIGWLLRRRSIEWLGWAVLAFVPVTLCVVMIINTLIYAIEDNPRADVCSGGVFWAETIIGLIASVVVGIGMVANCHAPFHNLGR